MTLYQIENSESKARKAVQYQLRTALNSARLWEVDVIRPDGVAVFPLACYESESVALKVAVPHLANGTTAVKLAGAVTVGTDLFVFGAVLDFVNGSIVSTTDARIMCELADGFGLSEFPARLRAEFPALAVAKRGRHRDTRSHLRIRDMVLAWEFATGRKVATGENARFIKVAAALGYDRPTVTNYLKAWHSTMPPCPIIQRLAEEMAISPRG